ncbi:MAG: cyclic nucleotide-binding domain-containing protein, partial [Panacagrimonas sp.]
LDQEGLESLARASTEVHLRRGERLYEAGDPANLAYVVANGSVRLVLGSGAKETTLGVVGQGDSFGEIALLDDTAHRSATVLALEGGETRAIHKLDFDALRARHPDERIYTFWDYFRQHWQRNAGLRIDHLLLNRHAAPLLSDAGVDRWVRGLPQASDHAPVWAALKLPQSRSPDEVRGCSGGVKQSPRTSSGLRKRRPLKD